MNSFYHIYIQQVDKDAQIKYCLTKEQILSILSAIEQKEPSIQVDGQRLYLENHDTIMIYDSSKCQQVDNKADLHNEITWHNKTSRLKGIAALDHTGRNVTHEFKIPEHFIILNDSVKENMNRFSKRYGHTTVEKPITVRENAPQGLREFLIMTVYEFGYEPSWLRSVICKVIKKVPQADNWSEYPNIDRENVALLNGCEWYLVYDVIESLAKKIDKKYLETFESELNDYFKANGIGWKLENGQIETRGDETFENSVSQVITVLETAKLQTAHSEMKEALADLSRRPHPDITGAIQHSLACLECVCRETTGDKKATLGELIKKFPGIVPKPLDSAIEKIWGFTSEQGRHLREGNEPDYLEAELVVELVAALATYLGKKLGGTA